VSSRISPRHLRLVGALLALGVLASACGSDANASAGGSDLSVSIAAPADGATVGTSFVVNLGASVPIGDPSTGEHHVHLCFDGDSCDSKYVLAYQDHVQVDGLAPGEHTIEASLRNADHSDAGPTDTITVTVSANSGTSTGGATGGSGSMGGGGYGY
jgi:hypothetical protein